MKPVIKAIMQKPQCDVNKITAKTVSVFFVQWDLEDEIWTRIARSFFFIYIYDYFANETC